jgi:hypothetical protein
MGWKWAAYYYNEGPMKALYSPREQEVRPLTYDNLDEIPLEDFWDEGMAHLQNDDYAALTALRGAVKQFEEFGDLLPLDITITLRGDEANCEVYGQDLGGMPCFRFEGEYALAKACCHCIISLAKVMSEWKTYWNLHQEQGDNDEQVTQ